MTTQLIRCAALVFACAVPGAVLADEALKQAAAGILDDSLPRDRREALIELHAKSSAALLHELTADLTPGTPEENRRIPWIWRVTVAAGKRNESKELLSVLDSSLSAQDGPLLEWQAVVLGGGIINGISLAGDWPRERIESLLKDQPALQQRWRRSLEQAALMADNKKVIDGTRYDALRIVALDDWDRARPLLARYLASENAELQQGAVSGLADLTNSEPEAAKMLIGALDSLAGRNRDFALDGLLRSVPGRTALYTAIEAGKLDKSILGPVRRERLLNMKDAADQKNWKRLLEK